jgi:hypothetical protein
MNNYLPDDIINIIYKYLHQMKYNDVMNELKEKHAILTDIIKEIENLRIFIINSLINEFINSIN